MKNYDEWKSLLAEAMDGFEIIHHDKDSVVLSHNEQFLVIEKSQDCNGLQISWRKTPDPEDTIATENIIVDGKIVSALTPSNHEGIKKILLEFVSKF